MGDFEALLQRQSSIAARFNENTQDTFGCGISQEVLEPTMGILREFCEYKNYTFEPKMAEVDAKLAEIRSMVSIC